MKHSVITFRSVTPAQRGESYLKKMGYACSLRRTPKWMQEQGCGYSIQIRYQDAQDCVQLLRDRQIPFKKLYLLRDNGTAEELNI